MLKEVIKIEINDAGESSTQSIDKSANFVFNIEIFCSGLAWKIYIVSMVTSSPNTFKIR